MVSLFVKYMIAPIAVMRAPGRALIGFTVIEPVVVVVPDEVLLVVVQAPVPKGQVEVPVVVVVVEVVEVVEVVLVVELVLVVVVLVVLVTGQLLTQATIASAYHEADAWTLVYSPVEVRV